MSDHFDTPSVQEGHCFLHRLLRVLCIGAAGLGGLAVFGVSILVTVSVVLRNLGFGGIRGDFELVEISCAVCASLFLPLCQLTRGHVMVDLFTQWMPVQANSVLDAFWTLVFAATWAFLCWRLSLGLMDMQGYGDRTMLLRAPVWWIYVPAILGTGLSAVVALFMSWEQISTTRARGEVT